MSSNFRHILTNWYLTDDKTSNEQEQDENIDGLYCNFIYSITFPFFRYSNIHFIINICCNFIIVSSPVDFITNIALKKNVSRRDRENIMSNLPHFNSELLLSFKDIGFKSALTYSQMSWYKLATYTIKETDVFSKIHLHIGDFVTIQEEDHDKCYAIIKGIFKHKGNNDKFYAFIVIDWFEDTNRIHNILKCPLYRIQTTHNTRWRRIFPISIIDRVQKVHFVYDVTSEFWIKNNFYFTAI